MSTTQGLLHRDGVEVHWWLRDDGVDAPLVVCTHGGAMNRRMWDAQVSGLAPDHRILTYDLRGHGESTCPAGEFSLDAACDDLVGLLDEVGADRAVLVGHSLGAGVSQLVALRHPERVVGLVGIGAACITLRPTTTARARQAVNPLALRMLGQRRVRRMFAESAGERSETKEYAADAIAALDDATFAAVMETGFGRYEPVPDDYSIAAPVLLLHGDKEPYGAFLGQTARWVERDSAKLVVVPGAAHNANQDSPDFVNEQLRAFLADLSDRPS